MADADSGGVVAALVALGFSLNESRAYHALLQESPATGYEVGVRRMIPRSAVYGVLRRLVSVGAARSIAGYARALRPRASGGGPHAPAQALRRLGELARGSGPADRHDAADPRRLQREGLPARARGGGAPDPRARSSGSSSAAGRARSRTSPPSFGAPRSGRSTSSSSRTRSSRSSPARSSVRARGEGARGVLEAPPRRRRRRPAHAHRRDRDAAARTTPSSARRTRSPRSRRAKSRSTSRSSRSARSATSRA